MNPNPPCPSCNIVSNLVVTISGTEIKPTSDNNFWRCVSRFKTIQCKNCSTSEYKVFYSDTGASIHSGIINCIDILYNHYFVSLNLETNFVVMKRWNSYGWISQKEEVLTIEKPIAENLFNYLADNLLFK